MTKEELIALATKVKEEKASPEEMELFLKEFKGRVDELNKYLSSLKQKNI